MNDAFDTASRVLDNPVRAAAAAAADVTASSYHTIVLQTRGFE